MTLSEWARFISRETKAEVFSVERGPDGHVSNYCNCIDPATGRRRHFAITCDAADEIRVWPAAFNKLKMEKAPPVANVPKALAGKRRSILHFDDMHIIGYGFRTETMQFSLG